jgi:hypothetical protein
MKRTLLPAALLTVALAGCGGTTAVDDTASPAVDGIPKISGETTAETPGGEIPAPAAAPEAAPVPESTSPDPGTPPAPPADPATPPPAESSEEAPPVTPPSP